jgi:hypothetical protein
MIANNALLRVRYVAGSNPNQVIPACARETKENRENFKQVSSPPGVENRTVTVGNAKQDLQPADRDVRCPRKNGDGRLVAKDTEWETASMRWLFYLCDPRQVIL